MEKNEKQNSASVIVELQVNMKTSDQKNVQIDSVATIGKLTKADAGRNGDEDWLTMKMETDISPCGKIGVPKVETSYHSKEVCAVEKSKC
ncbi:MAG: hypothetical protein JNJ40_06800 [Bacteroidia bacterium]|nr:hypothetical protein [Bacteroidia bacterium]